MVLVDGNGAKDTESKIPESKDAKRGGNPNLIDWFFAISFLGLWTIGAFVIDLLFFGGR